MEEKEERERSERSAWGTACVAFRMVTEFSVPSQGRRGTAPLNQLCHFYAPRLIFAVFYHSSVIDLFSSPSFASSARHFASNINVETMIFEWSFFDELYDPLRSQIDQLHLLSVFCCINQFYYINTRLMFNSKKKRSADSSITAIVIKQRLYFTPFCTSLSIKLTHVVFEGFICRYTFASISYSLLVAIV